MFQSKNIIPGILFIGILYISSCTEDVQLTKIEVGQEFVLKEGESVNLIYPTDQSPEVMAKLDVIKITESRCPSDAQCVRAGEAIVKIGLTGIREVLKTGEMCIGDCIQFGSTFSASDTAIVNIDNIYITLILTSVDPYPSLSNQDADKRATLIFEDYTLVR